MSRPDALQLSPLDGDAVDIERGSIFFVGTATVIIRYAGFSILTDPNFLHAGDHVHLGYGLTAERRTNPAIDIEELPEVDFVLLSHFHGDHFDQLVQERLDPDLPIVTTNHAAEKLSERGFRETYPLDSWETLTVSKGDVTLDVTATPGRHGPPVVHRALPPVMGSILEFELPENDIEFCIYITGDTLVYDELRKIPERYPEIDIALLHLGGTKILGVLLTMDAAQGVAAVELFDADVSIPVHYDDYDVFRSPLPEFEEVISDAGLDDQVVYLDRGDTYEFTVPGDYRG